MDNIVSVTLIPISGINVKLDSSRFSGNFVEISKNILNDLPVGSSIEVIYDHIFTDRDGIFKKIRTLNSVITQTKRGEFKHYVRRSPVITDMKSVYKRRTELKVLKNKFKKGVM